MLKQFLSDKINGTKNALFFLSPAPTNHSFTFNLRFLYELKHKVGLSKTVCETFHFLKTCMDSLTLKCHNLFEN